MRVYLVQHGEALAKEVDPERGLSPAGLADIERLGDFLGRGGLRIGAVWHSGKRRAQQTAERLAAAVAPGVDAQAAPGLNPLDPVDPWVNRLTESNADTLLAGHQPFMGKLASRLLAGREDAMVCAFVPGTAACLERGEDGGWSLVWMAPPGLPD